jgi:hypothetical protein
MEIWSHTVKMHHYSEFMDTLADIISSTSLETRHRDTEITIPKFQRVKERTYFIRNTHPELARGIKTIADCLINLYKHPSFLNCFHVTTLYVITSRFSFILQHKRGEDRKNQLRDLRTQVEEQKPLEQLTFIQLINHLLNMLTTE